MAAIRKYYMDDIMWVSIHDKLPLVKRNILVKGYYELDTKLYYEKGFRVTEDNVTDMRKGNFLNFSFNVLFWSYYPLSENGCER